MQALAPAPLPTSAKTALRIDRLSKAYNSPRGPVTALDSIDLVAPQGDFVTIIGPSGCGKSTLLKIVAGLEGDYTGAAPASAVG